MTIRRLWQRPETVPIWAEIKLGGALTDPTEDVLLTVVSKESGETILDEVVMTKDSTGMYVYYWTSEVDSEVGWYTAKAFAQDGTGDDAIITLQYGGFYLQ